MPTQPRKDIAPAPRRRRVQPLTVLTVSEEPLVGRSLAALLDSAKSVSASYGGPLNSVADGLGDKAPHAVVWFGDNACGETLATLNELRRRHADLALCIVALRLDAVALQKLISHGAGRLVVVLRTDDIDAKDLMRSLVQAVNGRATLSPSLLEHLVSASSTEDDALDTLSPRELDVLRMLSAGLRNREIARRLKRSEKLVERHVGRVFAKLGLNTDDAHRLDRRVMAARAFILDSRRKAAELR